MSEPQHGWIQVDELWFYIQGLNNLHTEIKGPHLTFSGICDGQLSDPLLGREAEIKRYIDHSHRYPGVAVELGALSLGWWMEGDSTVVRYQYLRGRLKWSLTFTTKGELKRHHHRRLFFLPSGNISGMVETSQPVTQTAGDGVVFTPNNDLEKNIYALKQIHRQITDATRPTY